MIAAGASVRENSTKGIFEKCPMSMFCGLPTSVATLPMLALVASAMRYGQHRQSPAPDHRDDKRGQHQANGVIDQQRRENSRRQREVKEQPLRRAREFQHRVG